MECLRLECGQTDSSQSLDQIADDVCSAWLNEPEAVRVLLDCSAGRMLVDGMDLLGATPLMCPSLLEFISF